MGSALVECLDNGVVETDMENADVLVDVSHPDALSKHLANKPLIVGSTGHGKENMSALRQLSESVPVLFAPNFSLGIALLKSLVAQVQDKVQAKVHIHEVHHKNKKDSPSGTALMLAEALQDADVTAERIEGEVGTHEVHFHFGDEELILTHRAKSRDAFAKGALAAIKWIQSQPPGWYTMDNILW